MVVNALKAGWLQKYEYAYVAVHLRRWLLPELSFRPTKMVFSRQGCRLLSNMKPAIEAKSYCQMALCAPKKLKVGKTAEIRCQLKRDGRHFPTTYKIRLFRPDGKGVLKMNNGILFLLNYFYPLEKKTFQLYYTSASTDHQTINVYVEDSFQHSVQLTFSFTNGSSKEEE